MRFAPLFLAASALLSAAPQNDDATWWKNAVIYEVYPRSFGDSNGDGIGDLNGITQHLDYLKDLGVDAIWISPFFPSPQVDFGYDISDYRGIDPQFGTMADFDRLVAEAKKRDMKIVADMVANHTSDQHPWFIESKSSRTNPKANWYVWRNGKNNAPPNNWLSLFGGSAWQFESSRNQYYYHRFYKQQPDLNWRDRQVRNAVYDVFRFWMNKGVYGIRLDAITSVFEDPQFRDEPYTGRTNEFGERAVTKQYTENSPEIHQVLREMRQVSNEFPGRILIGETYLDRVGDLLDMYGRNQDELQLPMDFQLGFLNQLSAPKFRELLADAETRLNGNIPLFVFDNHDNPRSANRYGDGKHDDQIQRLIATLLLTPRDVAMLYYGQEIGMVDHEPTSRDQVQDPKGKLSWPKDKGRDAERTPMQWNSEPQAGFTNSGKPWLPVGSDYQTINVAKEENDPGSLLSYYKKLIRLKKTNPQLRSGDYVAIDETNPAVLSFLRQDKQGSVLVSLNCTAEPQTLDMTQHGVKPVAGTPLIASYNADPQLDLKNLRLPAYGSLVVQLAVQRQ